MRAGDAESKHNDDSGDQYPAYDYECADDFERIVLSALSSEGDIAEAREHVRLGPTTDSRTAANVSLLDHLVSDCCPARGSTSCCHGLRNPAGISFLTSEHIVCRGRTIKWLSSAIPHGGDVTAALS
jgi:hypothetical protein